MLCVGQCLILQVVRITAYDGGKPSRSASTLVNVTVIDVNDNSPRFTSSSYDITVPEDAAVGSILMRIEATDPDAGLNGEVEYLLYENLRQGSSADRILPFTVDRWTGEINLVDRLDFEKQQAYSLSVVATDGGYDTRSDRVRLYVQVVDVNDNAPQILVNPSGRGRFDGAPPSNYAARGSTDAVSVSELAPPGSFVAHMSVSDPDSGVNGQFACFVDVGSGRMHFALRRLYDGEYTLVTAVGLDREQCAAYDVAVTCTDFGESRQVATRVVRVEIDDENDNRPTFAVDRLDVSIVENNDVGCALIDASAVDRDSGMNAAIIYSLEPADDVIGRALTIDRATGTVRALASFSRRMTVGEMNFRVIARDMGRPSNSAALNVTLRIVEDRHGADEVAVFPTGHYVFHVYENQPVGIQFGAVSASATDDGHVVTSSLQVGSFYFSLVEDGSKTTTRCCEVDGVTGSLSTTVTLDREKQSSFHLIVSVAYRRQWRLRGRSSAVAAVTTTDRSIVNRCRRPRSTNFSDLQVSADGQRTTLWGSSSATITVYVNDINDNRPTLLFPTADNNTLTVNLSTDDDDASRQFRHRADMERQLSTSPCLRAVDLDRGQNAIVMYSIVGGNGSAIFGVDSITGQLKLNDVELPTLTHMTTMTYKLDVEVVDGGRPPMTSRATLTIVVIHHPVSRRPTVVTSSFAQQSGAWLIMRSRATIGSGRGLLPSVVVIVLCRRLVLNN